MLLRTLREGVLEANLQLVRRGLVLYTFGNASGISRKDGLAAIKPSGVPYDELTPEHMVVTKLDGEIVEGELRPSTRFRRGAVREMFCVECLGSSMAILLIWCRESV